MGFITKLIRKLLKNNKLLINHHHQEHHQQLIITIIKDQQLQRLLRSCCRAPSIIITRQFGTGTGTTSIKTINDSNNNLQIHWQQKFLGNKLLTTLSSVIDSPATRSSSSSSSSSSRSTSRNNSTLINSHKKKNHPTAHQVVIAGAGIIGNSVAYHLVENGWKDVLVLEQNEIASGTSNYGSGILGLLKPIAMRNVIAYSLKLYKQLATMGYDIGLKQCGSINLAQTKDRLISLKRRIAYNQPLGLHCEFLSARELQNIHPFINCDDLEGAVWVADDAVANIGDVSVALAELAKRGGAEYLEHCRIRNVTVNEKSQVNGVQTFSHGTIQCEYFINCCGMWSRELGLKSTPKVCIPSYPANHYYAQTRNLQLNRNGGPRSIRTTTSTADHDDDDDGDPDDDDDDDHIPIIRDYDGQTFFRQMNGEMLIGWFEKMAQPAYELNVVPQHWQTNLMHYDDLHLRPLIERSIQRMPFLKDYLKFNDGNSGNQNLSQSNGQQSGRDDEMREIGMDIRNSPDNFTPDGRWILGETAEIKKYFVACGANGNSLQCAGGIGRAVAEWLIEGSPTQELQTFSIQRFLDLHNNRNYLQQRTKEIVGRHYEILYPNQCEYKYARKLRCSPLYSVLEARGAVFGIKMAYERALYFDTTYKPGVDQLPKQMPAGSFYKPKFFDFMLEEYQACREGVGIIDISSFSKIEIKSTSSVNENAVLMYLQKMCSNDVNIPVGGIAHTGMQNDRGGYENDCMLVRQTNERFFMVSPSNQQTRIFQWMSLHLPRDASVCLTDVTSMYTVINVVGPKAGQLMAELSNADINLSPFTYKKINVGYASDVMVMSFTHTGEPGYCLFVPSEYAIHVYEQLMHIGFNFGARDVGTLTQRFMRIEKFIPFWGEELTSFVTPYETGYGHQVKLDKEYFIGKYALQKQRENGVSKRLVMFHLENIDVNKDVWPWGGEPLYRNNEFVGTVTSAGYSFTKNTLICLGFIQCSSMMATTIMGTATAAAKTNTRIVDNESIITNEFILDKNAHYEIDIAGKRFALRPYLSAPKLPKTIEIKPSKVIDNYKPTVVKMKT